MNAEIKLTPEQSKAVGEFFDRGYAYKQAVADLAEKAHLANKEAWILLKGFFPDVDFDKNRYIYNPNSGVITKCEEKNPEIVIK